MKVIFIRHGQTDYNVKGLINGDKNVIVHLTAKGRKQVVVAAKKLAAIPFDVIYRSEFIRAKETTEILNSVRDIPVIVDKRVNESWV